MKQRIIIITSCIILAGVAVLGYVLFFKNNDATAPSGQTVSATVKTVDACGSFTLDDAQSVMGKEAKKGVAAAPIENNNVRLTTCSYVINPGTATGVISAALMVRSPINQEGIKSNEDAFTLGQPAGVQVVEGYGDKAFWDPATGSLNVLKDDQWYSIAYGGVSVADNSIDKTKPLADKILN